MVNHAQSKAKKTQILSEEHDIWMNKAVNVYHTELVKPNGKKRGLRKVCDDVEAEFFKETGRSIHLAHKTLSRWSQGGIPQSQFNHEKSWLTGDEEQAVIAYAIELGARGFPLSHRRLKEHVDEVCHAHYGDKFPEEGVGKNWTDRFVSSHHQLSTYWAKSLDNARGRAVNPTTNTMWFCLLGKVIAEEKIEEDTIYGMDETGFQPGGGASERVIGAAGKKTQHQQKDGNRENITVIVTICADGTSLPPAVIFKGQNFLVKWDQDNPLNASYVYDTYNFTTIH